MVNCCGLHLSYQALLVRMRTYFISIFLGNIVDGKLQDIPPIYRDTLPFAAFTYYSNLSLFHSHRPHYWADRVMIALLYLYQFQGSINKRDFFFSMQIEGSTARLHLLQSVHQYATSSNLGVLGLSLGQCS